MCSPGLNPVARGSGAAQGHALRGGAWEGAAADVRAASRSGVLPQIRPPTGGLRCVIGSRLWDSPPVVPIIKPAIVWGAAGGGGAYAQTEEERQVRGQPTLAITYGHSKDHRPDLKQLLFILTVSEDGGVPIYFTSASGNTSDDTTHRATCCANSRGEATFFMWPTASWPVART